VTVSILGRRYASALLALAEERKNVDHVRRDLSDFVKSWNESRELRTVFENPSVSAEARRNVLREIGTRTSMDPQLLNTLLVLADRGRLSQLPDVFDSFEAMAEAKSGKLRAEVTSAAELPEAYFTELGATLERVTGRKVSVTHKVDPSLLGGVVTRVGDRVFDGSLKNRLSELKDELLR
jgi:F-type H+-transporting ATPase subunit delta